MFDALRQARQRLSSFFRKSSLDSDLEAEMASHLELAVEENLKRGMNAEEARRQAKLRFGGVQQAKEIHRQTRGLPLMDIILQDLRYSFRTLRRDFGFMVIAVVILALGIGANVTVFSVVNRILLRPLPFDNPQQLVWITPKDARSGMSSMTYSADGYDELRAQNRSFQDVTGYFAFSTENNYSLFLRDQPKPLTGINVIGNFFQVLGVQPMLGRLFTADELRQNGSRAVLLSYSLWKQQFGADPNIVGKPITLNTVPVTVIGVMPESFDFGSVFSPGIKVDLYTPAILDDMRDWGNVVTFIGRLKPGVTIGQAQAEADILFPTLHGNAKRFPAWKGYTGKLLGLKEYVSGKLRRSLFVLWGAVGMILLIVCVNLSNLLLARAAARSKEFAMRSALGAGRARIVCQLLTESLVLSSIGAFFGLCLAYGLTAYLAHQGSVALPLLSQVSVDGTVLLWTVFVAIFASLLFGLVPSLRMSGKNLQESLKDAGPGMSEGRKHERLRTALVVSEVALACMLLVGAGLLLRSFMKVLEVDLGFEPTRSAALRINYPKGNNPEERGAGLKDLLQRVSAIPGIESASVTDSLPLDWNRSWGLSAKGKSFREGELPGAFVYIVTPGYLGTMGMHLLEGRDFNWSDTTKSLNVVIVNQSAARYLWPGQDPIGQIAEVSGSDAVVIGVVADVRESSLEGHPGWQIYMSMMQQGPAGAELVVRTKLAPSVLASSVMSVVRSIDPNQPATEFRPIQTFVDHAVSPRGFFMLLVGIFAVLGLLLASLGIYGVIAYSVARKTQEIGIRMALGATQGRVLAGVIARTMIMALLGIATGTVASLLMAKGIASLLFGTQPHDPTTYAGMVIVLVVVAFIAGYIPALRASRVNPMVALRNN